MFDLKDTRIGIIGLGYVGLPLAVELGKHYPTMGLDAGAAHDIYQALFTKAREGAAVLWISEDLDDLMSYAHRIAVLQGGRISGLFNPGQFDRLDIGRAMTGEHLPTADPAPAEPQARIAS